MEYEDLKLPFFHNNIDIESIAEKCGYHMKEIVAGNINFDALHEQEIENCFRHTKRELFCQEIPVLCGDEMNKRCIELKVFKDIFLAYD